MRRGAAPPPRSPSLSGVALQPHQKPPARASGSPEQRTRCPSARTLVQNPAPWRSAASLERERVCSGPPGVCCKYVHLQNLPCDQELGLEPRHCKPLIRIAPNPNRTFLSWAHLDPNVVGDEGLPLRPQQGHEGDAGGVFRSRDRSPDPCSERRIYPGGCRPLPEVHEGLCLLPQRERVGRPSLQQDGRVGLSPLGCLGTR